MTPDRLDEIARRTIKALSRLERPDRDRVVERIRRADPELEPVVRAYVAQIRLRMPLRRDGLI